MTRSPASSVDIAVAATSADDLSHYCYVSANRTFCLERVEVFDSPPLYVASCHECRVILGILINRGLATLLMDQGLCRYKTRRGVPCHRPRLPGRRCCPSHVKDEMWELEDEQEAVASFA